MISQKDSKLMSRNIENSDAIQLEIDKIHSLLTYAIVFKYWEDDDRNGRGYNVGCLLVSPENKVLDWGLNFVKETENCTQHGEVRLMTNYLNKEEIYSLNGHTIFTTLEPCAMCAGMMTMASVKRTVNGQKDYFFANTLERLAFDSKQIGGYEPYPRKVISEETPTSYGDLLDNAYLNYINSGNKPILTKFLATEVARVIFETATNEFLNFKTDNMTIKEVYQETLNFFNTLPNKPK